MSVVQLLGSSVMRFVWPGVTTPAQIKAAPGRILGIRTFNIGANSAYLKLYDSVAAPTVGTTAPLDVIGIPGNADGGGNNDKCIQGRKFANGLWVAVTTGITDADTTAPTANQILVTIDYD